MTQTARLIASLGMYDSAGLAPANDRLWALIRSHLQRAGHSAPAALTRGEAAYMPAWQDPDLLLSQTCGYPFRTLLRDKVTLVASPDHALEHSPPGWYHSVLIARQTDARDRFEAFDGAAFAWNDDLSQSGWAAPVQFAQDCEIRLKPQFRSGSHRGSAQALRDGKADLAAIDAVTWAMMGEDGSDHAAGLKVIGRTPSTPALPYITARLRDPAPLLAAFTAALQDLAAKDRAALHLRDLVTVPMSDYLKVPNPPSPAQYAA